MPEKHKRNLSPKSLLLLLLLAGAWFAQQRGWLPIEELVGAGSEWRPITGDDEQGAAAILDAFQAQRSDLMVQASGVVEKVLPDDREGSRHQRFILRLANAHTLLLAHNIDLAPRVPLEEGETVAFRGEYEWNQQGGVIHWTHHDPSGKHPGGWLECRGKRYE